MSVRTFGHIPNVYEGDKFENRIALSHSKVHRPTQAGISGSQKEGADSIVLSGGYEDDLDEGDVIRFPITLLALLRSDVPLHRGHRAIC
jgi:putative restriction endonuclease